LRRQKLCRPEAAGTAPGGGPSGKPGPDRGEVEGQGTATWFFPVGGSWSAGLRLDGAPDGEPPPPNDASSESRRRIDSLELAAEAADDDAQPVQVGDREADMRVLFRRP